MRYMTHEAMIPREAQGNFAEFRTSHAAHSFGVMTSAKDSFPGVS
jgi:hypothetical protein